MKPIRNKKTKTKKTKQNRMETKPKEFKGHLNLFINIRSVSSQQRQPMLRGVADGEIKSAQIGHSFLNLNAD